jgi:hypothetical protein
VTITPIFPLGSDDTNRFQALKLSETKKSNAPELTSKAGNVFHDDSGRTNVHKAETSIQLVTTVYTSTGRLSSE